MLIEFETSFVMATPKTKVDHSVSARTDADARSEPKLTWVPNWIALRRFSDFLGLKYFFAPYVAAYLFHLVVEISSTSTDPFTPWMLVGSIVMVVLFERCISIFYPSELQYTSDGFISSATKSSKQIAELLKNLESINEVWRDSLLRTLGDVPSLKDEKLDRLRWEIQKQTITPTLQDFIQIVHVLCSPIEQRHLSFERPIVRSLMTVMVIVALLLLTGAVASDAEQIIHEILQNPPELSFNSPED